MNIQDGFPIGLTILISLLSKGSQESSPTHSLKASIFWHSALFMIQLSHLYMTTGKTIALTIQASVSKVTSLLFNMLSMFFIVFLPRRKYLSVTICSDFGAQENKLCHCFHLHRNQIDYILWSQRWRSSIQSTKIRPADDCGLDQELFITKFRRKLKTVQKNARPFKYDLN